MSRKQKALEERYRKPAPYLGNKVKPFIKTECTLADVLGEVDLLSKGYWNTYFVDESTPPNWQIERDSIIKVASERAIKDHVRDPSLQFYETDLGYFNLLKQYATTEWKLRRSKLYKAMR